MTQDTDILVVEDSPTQAETLREILQKENYGVFLAEDSGKALEMMKERRFALILSDIQMPGMNGYQFCRKVKDDPATKDIPVILLTALSDPGDVITILECGADNFIAKPFEPAYLLSWIKHHLVTLALRRAGGAQADLKFFFSGLEHSIAPDRMHILDILLSTYEAVVQKDREVKKAQGELEHQFRQAQKMEAVGRLAGGIAHDFNNLLTAIEGYADFLLGSLAPDDKRRGDAEEIKKAADAATTLTRQLLTFSRHQVFQPQVLDCNEVIRSTQKLLKKLIGENIALELDLPEEECRTKADPGQIEQIVANLIINAKDAMPGGGKVTIKTENVELDGKYSRMRMEAIRGPHVMIAVTDTGCGMGSEVMTHLFEPFFTTKEVGKGTGLGLSTVYGIVKQSGGDIYVYSEPGLGTTFKIYLPRTTEKATARAESSPPKALRGSETILLVEDDDAVRRFALRALRGNGYTVLEAGAPEEAARLFDENAGSIGLVLTDTVMPDMNGHELYGLLAKRRPGLKAIFMSGYTDSDHLNPGIEVAQMPFLQKPFSADTLAAKVREVLDSREAAGVGK
ncbi:MAG TPA: hybrid sensor histidine kinase/response regulator [Elusimicrobia bacterium]|nr:hybrid sensor histidine kinase/response regulator [Elusimicrobiota bacterium]